ncbi:MAG: hypothetical protein ACM359_20335 [Bacillota bacterium]
MTAKELAEKTEYLRNSAFIYRDLANGLTDDHRRRILARGVLVALDSFLKMAPQLKNRLPNTTRAEKDFRGHVEERLDQLKRDYDAHSGGYFDKIRDGFAGHRLPIALGDVIELWTDIDQSVGDVLAGDMQDVCSDLSAFGISPVSPNLHTEIASAIPLINGLIGNGAGPHVSADDLGMTRLNTVSLVPNQGQIRYCGIVSLIEFTTFEWRCAAAITTDDVQERLIALILLDAFNFLDNLYNEKDQNGHTIYDELLLTNRPEAAAVLKGGIDARDSALEAELRNVRNHFAAHLDQTMSLHDIRAEMKGARLADFGVYIGKHITVFRSMCASHVTLQPFLIHDKQIKGFDDIANRPKGFDLH